MMLTGVPVRASSEPAWAAKASGISICDGETLAFTATTTTTGISAATAPFTLIRAVRIATKMQTKTRSGVRFVPPRLMTCWPAQVVTPVESRASLTTNSEAMKRTVGSPKPAKASCKVRMPVAQRLTATPIATTPTATRFDMKARTATPSTINVIATGLILGTLVRVAVGGALNGSFPLEVWVWMTGLRVR